jgi:hypothetical protein
VKTAVTASGEGGTPAKVVESKLAKAIASLVSVVMVLQGKVFMIVWQALSVSDGRFADG